MNQYLHIFRNIPNEWHAYWGNMNPGMMNWGYGTNWLGTLIWLAILIAVVVAIIALVRWMTISNKGSSRTHHPSDSAMEILRRRYAKGEISKEQFTAMKHELEE
ncbi:MAG: SHOCT domain-containing protein [Deltaproteobacteria bacterium]|jgi:putative membrane protein|nr:SHOCT domain-containing protein [Deltaproteobacteria bacterium]